MAFKTVYSPGPDYQHFVGSRVRLSLEGGQTAFGVIREQLPSSVRGDNLLVVLDTPIKSPFGETYNTVLIATRAAEVLTKDKSFDVYVCVPSQNDPSDFTLATSGSVTLMG